ncbi:hypothetical protein FACS189447_01630 [Spirochaetia bacterium]|nr:hypothetical protein FACS189447_01630 [Spirochaetia bacterium]
MTQLMCHCKDKNGYPKRVVYEETDPCPVSSEYHPAYGWRRFVIDGKGVMMCPECAAEYLKENVPVEEPYPKARTRMSDMNPRPTW